MGISGGCTVAKVNLFLDGSKGHLTSETYYYLLQSPVHLKNKIPRNIFF